MAIEIVSFPIQNGDVQMLCEITRGYHVPQNTNETTPRLRAFDSEHNSNNFRVDWRYITNLFKRMCSINKHFTQGHHVVE